MSADDPHAVHVSGKPHYSYSIEGLPAREELLFKSMVRVVGHKTRHEWLYSPHSTYLQVISETVSARSGVTGLRQSQQVLVLGLTRGDHPGFLGFPLRPDDLVAELDRLGGLMRAVSVAQEQASTSGGFARTVPTEAAAMRMTRWPPADLLLAPGRIKLATLMTGRPMTIYSLQQSSGQSLSVCQDFMEALKKAKLLDVADVTTRPPVQSVAAAPPPGLLARIRQRLGLNSNAGSR